MPLDGISRIRSVDVTSEGAALLQLSVSQYGRKAKPQVPEIS